MDRMTCLSGCSPWYGPERPKWVGPLPYAYPRWLPEEAPGNYGFDPAGLSRDSAKFDRYFELELLHARWAMLGALGAVLPGAAPTSWGNMSLSSAGFCTPNPDMRAARSAAGKGDSPRQASCGSRGDVGCNGDREVIR